MEDLGNIYLIRRKLAELTPAPGCHYYELFVGRFVLKIVTTAINEHQVEPILESGVVDAYLYETLRGVERYIDLRGDPRFKDYQPIIYNEVRGINLGTGKDMPIPHLCELIQYLYRLSNLSAFW